MVTKDFGVTHARRHLKRHALPMDGLFSGDRRGVFGLVPRSQLISQIGRLTEGSPAPGLGHRPPFGLGLGNLNVSWREMLSNSDQNAGRSEEHTNFG
jgi:hypothetical protein